MKCLQGVARTLWKIIPSCKPKLCDYIVDGRDDPNIVIHDVITPTLSTDIGISQYDKVGNISASFLGVLFKISRFDHIAIQRNLSHKFAAVKRERIWLMLF